VSSRLRTALLYTTSGALGALLGLISHDVFGRSLRVPLFYKGDALFYGAAFKGTLVNGWYEVNPYLGAPMGQNQHDFPQADNLQYVIAKLLGAFSDDWALVFNLTYLLTFPLAALAGTWFLRLVGCSAVTSVVLGALYAVAPYHFFHGISHLALSMYFVLPLGLGLAYAAHHERELWSRGRQFRWFDPREWARWGNAGVVAILILLGSTSSYYSVFTLLMLATVLVVLLLRRRVRSAGGVVTVMAGLITVMVANMAPDLWYARHSTSVSDFARLPQESEIFALKLSTLVLPTHWNRIGNLGESRLQYDGTFPLPGEPTALGAVAAVGFLFLLIYPVARLAVPRAGVAAEGDRGPGAVTSALVTLSLFNLVAFLFSTVGGFETLFALLVTPSIRSWGRMAIVIALLSLAAVGLLLDGGVRRFALPRLRGRRPTVRLSAAAAPAVLVLAFGLFDQLPSNAWTSTGTEAEEFASDAAYGAAVAAVVPPNGVVLQLPYLAFPESAPLNDITDYDPLRGFLHTDDVRWTYGAFKGTPRAAWSERVGDLPPEQLAVAAAASGIAGVHVDRFGYPQRDASAVEDGLRSVVGPPAVVSEDERFAFYDLGGLRREMVDSVPAKVLDEVRTGVVMSPALDWTPDFAPPVMEGPLLVARSTTTTPSIGIHNPTGRAANLAVSFTVRAENADEVASIAITWPDGRTSTVTAPPGAGTPVNRVVRVPPGESRLAFASDVGPSVTLISPTVARPGLSADLARIERLLERSDDRR